jgi:DNA-binding SARP family transcriptional activator
MSLDQVRVLGPIEVVVSGQGVAVGGRNTRAVLAALVLSLNHAVSADHLAWAVWGEEPPPSAHGTLQTYVSRLRRILGHEVIRFEDDAYRLSIDNDLVDAVRFERLAIQAEELLAIDAARSRSLSMEALGLWQGEPFGDLVDDVPFRIEVQRLEEMRIATMELRLEAEIALEHHVQVVGLLEAAVIDQPYRERLWYLLITALARDGRRVEALRAYRRLAELLAETGLEPSQDLRDLESQVIEEHPSVAPQMGSVDRKSAK